MASTEQVRNWYPEVVLNHAQRCTPGYTPKCDTSKAIRLAFPKEGGGVYNLLIHPKTKEAWQAYIQAMTVFGETVPPAGGSHNCRNIGTTNCPSLHAYCVALDLPPNNRKSEAFQVAVLGIKTNTGIKVFKNLTSINDRMHDQIDASPAALASGIDWSTVPSVDPPDPVPSDPDMNTPAFVRRLEPADINALVDTGVIKPAPGQTLDQTKAYWIAKLPNPNDPEWVNVHEETEAAALVNGATRAHAPLTVNVTGTATP